MPTIKISIFKGITACAETDVENVQQGVFILVS
jgi:hypothetical protein